MKRILPFLAALLLVSCVTDKPEYKTISLQIGGVQTGSLTKAEASGVNAAISATLPSTDIVLALQSKSVPTRKFSASVGQSITVPLDRYTVTGKFVPSVVGDAAGNNIYKTPAYSISDEVLVVESTDEYSVSATYDCFALVIDYGESAAYKHYQYNQLTEFGYFTRTGDIGIAYIGLDYAWSVNPYRLLVVPADYIEHEDTQYSLVTEGNGVKVEKGKWYCFGANEVTTTSGSLGINLPWWAQGN